MRSEEEMYSVTSKLTLVEYLLEQRKEEEGTIKEKIEEMEQNLYIVMEKRHQELQNRVKKLEKYIQNIESESLKDNPKLIESKEEEKEKGWVGLITSINSFRKSFLIIVSIVSIFSALFSKTIIEEIPSSNTERENNTESNTKSNTESNTEVLN